MMPLIEILSGHIMNKIKVQGAVVFVTGANRKRGIGRALVQEAIKRGASKVYATARDISQLEELVSKFNGKVIPVKLDVTNKDDITKAAELASDTQILINNSGYAGFSGFCFNYDEETARHELEVNYFGVLNLIRAFCKSLITNKNSAIANIISIGGLSAFPVAATYSASKAAAHSLTQTVRAELLNHHVSVFGVYPGPIDTDMADDIKFPKETSAHAARATFDGIEQGIEDIAPDSFAEDFVKQLQKDAKSVEKNNSDFAHKMPESF